MTVTGVGGASSLANIEPVLSNTKAVDNFLVACGGGALKGVAVVPFNTKTSVDDVGKALSEAKTHNGNNPLDTIVLTPQATNTPARTEVIYQNLASDASDWVKAGVLKPGATIAFDAGRAVSAKECQEAADAGFTVVVENENGAGTTVYEKGKEPAQNLNGSVSNGGYGYRGCTTPAGVS